MSFELQLFPELRHLTQDGKSNILLDINTSRLLEVDDVLLDLLTSVREPETCLDDLHGLKARYHEEELLDAYGVMQDLVDQGILIHQESLRLDDADSDESGSILLNLSHACQLSCVYCFADGGDYKRDSTKKIMSWDVAKAAIDFVNSRRKNRKMTVAFFGGEPLTNWDVIEQVVLYAEDLTREGDKSNVQFSMTTNAIALSSERATFLKQHNCIIMVSIDGGPEIHNRLRPTRDSSIDSWRSTMNGVNSLVAAGYPKPTARATITSLDVDVVGLVSVLRKEGFGKVNTQVVDLPNSHPLSLTHGQLLEYEQQQLGFLEKDLDSSSDLTRIMNDPSRGIRRKRFCGIGVGAWAVGWMLT